MLGVLINTFNDAKLLKFALQNFAKHYRGEYHLWIDDDGSNVQNEELLEKLVFQYKARLSKSPRKKGQSGAYLIVREMELFEKLWQSGANRLLKMDPDTIVYSSQAFAGPVRADLYGARKVIDARDMVNQRLITHFCSDGIDLPKVTDYCQGGFYVMKPALLERIIASSAWQRYLEIYSTMDFPVPEDRFLGLLVRSIGGQVDFWSDGFFHGARSRSEFYLLIGGTRYPKMKHAFYKLYHQMVLRRSKN